MAGHQGHRGIDEEVVHVVAAFAADLERVAESRGGEQSGARALALDEGIGGEGGAVDEAPNASRRRARFLQEGEHALLHGLGGILRGGEQLAHAHVAGDVVHPDEIGEGAADVHAQSAGAGGRAGHGQECRGLSRSRQLAVGVARRDSSRPRTGLARLAPAHEPVSALPSRAPDPARAARNGVPLTHARPTRLAPATLLSSSLCWRLPRWAMGTSASSIRAAAHVHYWDAFHTSGGEVSARARLFELYEATYAAGRELGAFDYTPSSVTSTLCAARGGHRRSSAVRSRSARAVGGFQARPQVWGPHINEWRGLLQDHGYNDPPPSRASPLLLRGVPPTRHRHRAHLAGLFLARRRSWPSAGDSASSRRARGSLLLSHSRPASISSGARSCAGTGSPPCSPALALRARPGRGGGALLG